MVADKCVYLDKLNNLTAKDIMDNNILVVSKGITLYESIFLMLENNVEDIILQEDDNILGIGTLNDFSKVVRKEDRDLLLQENTSSFLEKNVMTITSDTRAIEAKNLMKNQGIGRLPVLESGKLIGIIRVKDIINKLYNRIAEMNGNFINILNTIHEAICIVDKDGIVVMWDEQSEKLYGIKEEDILAKKIDEFFPTALLCKVLKERKAIENVYHSPKKGVYAIISAMPLFVDGEFIGAVSTDRNITEITNLTMKLEETKDKLHYLEQEVKKIGDNKYSFNNILGKSRIITEKIERAQKVARTNTNILITGESGTGKEMFARSIHQASGREGVLVTVNCSAIPENLFESEMFGYVAGAFTGASKRGKAGYFELANEGTLFLDEIGDMPMFMQSKLLRVLQEGKIKRVGAEEYIDVDVRVISATHRNLEKMIELGEFREDLFYRINVIKIEIPSLKERREDIPLLVRHFINQFCEENNLSVSKIMSEVLTVLMNYDWKGNIRELQNAVEHLVVFSQDEKIELNSLPKHIVNNAVKNNTKKQEEEILDLEAVVKRVEVDVIKRAMKITDGNKKQAAILLNIPRSTLYYKIKYYDLNELM